MSAGHSASIVLGFPEFRAPAQRFAAAAAMPYADVRVHRFPDGESLVRLPERLPPDVVLYTSLNNPNHRLIELELAAATALRLGAEKQTLVAPYLCYMRQDAAFRPGEAISQRIVGELLARHFDTLITIDPHLHRTARLDDAVPVRRAITLSATPVIADWLEQRAGSCLVIGPDEESEQWVEAIARAAGFEYAVARKQRFGDKEVRIALPECSFDGRDVMLVDDIASTGHTLAEAVRQILPRGAASVSVIVTHALFVDGAFEHLLDAGVSEVCSTDSIPHESNRLHLHKILASALTEDGKGGG